jgi:hypothetical protein
LYFESCFASRRYHSDRFSTAIQLSQSVKNSLFGFFIEFLTPTLATALLDSSSVAFCEFTDRASRHAGWADERQRFRGDSDTEIQSWQDQTK